MRAQVYASNGTNAQRFRLRRTAGGSFTIQAVCSGLYLTDVKGKVLQRTGKGLRVQRWKAAKEGGGIVFTNVATGRRLAVAGGAADSGAALSTLKAAKKNAQRFRLTRVQPIQDGCYELASAASGKVLGIAGASTANGASAKVQNAEGSSSQRWVAVNRGGGWYWLVNDNSGRVLGVAGASKAAKADVRQLARKKLASRLWRPVLRADGTMAFKNKASGLVFEAAGTADGANALHLLSGDLPVIPPRAHVVLAAEPSCALTLRWRKRWL